MLAGAVGLRLVLGHGNNSEQGYPPMLLKDKSSFTLSEFRALKGCGLHPYSACFSPYFSRTCLRAANPLHEFISFFLSFLVLLCKGKKQLDLDKLVMGKSGKFSSSP